MNCPLQDRDQAQQLLDYCSRKLDSQATAILEQHLANCPACSAFTAQQRAVSEALDAWDAPPVSADFNRRVYARIDQDVPWWHSLLRPMALRWSTVASAASVVVLLGAGLLLNRPTAVAPPMPDVAQVQPAAVQAEQVERALDAMDMLAEFDSQVKPHKSTDAKM